MNAAAPSCTGYQLELGRSRYWVEVDRHRTLIEARVIVVAHDKARTERRIVSPVTLARIQAAIRPPAVCPTCAGSTADAAGFEVMAWHDAAAGLPDCDTTVICWLASGEWYAGWWDDEAGAWMDAATGGAMGGVVTHWAAPEGPPDNAANERLP